ncbi:A/G-specific adenine glycosylase [Campylobacter helveticus]|uniref:A/G-specific adenine glycosylase n=1 Tax=Campylobacter helveticus TaxID=28898 RepID=UPI0011166BD8|nr:A/G-specific adenine glycosylase [Campylobacter helveticus]TNH33765.1 A/G-specific adenine glycosylase [Campylobacter helveticus]TNH36231.1 A/G-specific adenine glycosylase [Campylobacter helveticus]
MQKEMIEKLQKNLLKWYENNGRKTLPWRNLQGKANRAYAVYISEIMLQQTQVKIVLEKFYFPFLQKFPTLLSLANAKEDEILKAWQGLGYYTRARNLKKAAQQCVEEFGGFLPRKKKDLLKLCGIGNYTAGAVACFGYDACESFVDANISRILLRIFALENPTTKELEARAKLILNFKEPFDHNQALLDIGALLCLPKNPKCKLCPLNAFCKGKDTPDLYTKAKKTKYENLELDLVFLEFKGKFAIQKSTKKLYKGLYNFPFGEKIYLCNAKFVGEFKHTYTKYKLHIRIYHQILQKKNAKFEFKSLKELENLALSNLSLKALQIFKAKNAF